MKISSTLDRLHVRVKQNSWFRAFAIFCRVALAAGFIPSGLVKIMGERFTSLSNNHPMGHYLEALHHTGYYYTFIGIAQVTAAILLLIPRTALLGALLYFPIILNICMLSLAVRFDGSLISSPLMVLANLYLFAWYYDRLKLIFPYKRSTIQQHVPHTGITSHKFPVAFFLGSMAAILLLGFFLTNIFELRPRNTQTDCEKQCKGSTNPQACLIFCDCIHQKGQDLDQCLDEYHKAVQKTKK